MPAFDANVRAVGTTAWRSTRRQAQTAPRWNGRRDGAIIVGIGPPPRGSSGAPDIPVAHLPLPANGLAGLRPWMADVAGGGTAATTGLPAGTHAKTGTAQYYAQGKLRTDAWLMGFDGDLAFALVVQDSDNINGGPLDGPLAARFFSALGNQTRR